MRTAIGSLTATRPILVVSSRIAVPDGRCVVVRTGAPQMVSGSSCAESLVRLTADHVSGSINAIGAQKSGDPARRRAEATLNRAEILAVDMSGRVQTLHQG